MRGQVYRATRKPIQLWGLESTSWASLRLRTHLPVVTIGPSGLASHQPHGLFSSPGFSGPLTANGPAEARMANSL